MPGSVLQSARNFLHRHGLYPRSRLTRVALALVAVVVLWSFTGIRSLAFVYSIAVIVCASLLLIIAYRAFKKHFMWRLRNRLVVTYVFIGVIPLVLLATMGVAAGYLFAGQFSTFVVSTDVQGELRRLESSNHAIAHQAAAALRRKQPLESIRPGINNEVFPGRQIIAYYHGKSELLAGETSRPVPAPPSPKLPDSALVIDEGGLYLRAIHRSHLTDEDNQLLLVSSIPLDAAHMEPIVSNMGIISLYGERAASKTDRGDVHLSLGGKEMDVNPRFSSGTLPPPSWRYDVQFSFPTILNAMYWNSGEPKELLLTVRTRPSLLYGRLFRTLGDMTNAILFALAGVGVFFALIEVVALIIGIRLTRTMTSSVAKLYAATQHVNRGDLSHRIQVSSQDQLASLESSFNSMTISLEKLIAEQKEKQRIESELLIAKEVQDLLFPHDTADLDGLELHGICRPARTVSGDYYDFLPVGANAAGLAVGDISGKGISAALMMATVHSFIRAHTLSEPLPSLAAQAAVAGPVLVTATGQSDRACPAPGLILALLNQQLYRSTPAQKYATIFLGFYDQQSRQLNYSNAGHLPPFVICGDGSISRLDCGGTVVGLFGDMSYPEGRITLNPGDTVIAYSDGITEPENDFGEFGEERLAQIVLENLDQPLSRITDAIFSAVDDWIGGEEQPDDMTIVLARAR